MANVTPLAAEVRQRAGKGAARATRRAGRVPAVIYGNKQDPTMISLDPLDLRRQIGTVGFFARIFEIEVDGESHKVLARDIQVDPVTDRPIHVDFMRFGPRTRLNVDVTVVFENEDEAPGLKRGGVLNVVRHAIEMICKADSIPESITVDLTGLDIGDSVHVSDLDLPEGAQPTISDRDFTVATIAAPTLIAVEEEEEEEEEGEGLEEGEEGVEGVEGAEGAEGADKAAKGGAREGAKEGKE